MIAVLKWWRRNPAVIGKDFALGDWVVSPQQNVIARGSQATHVKPKSMAVLERLALADGEVVSRTELFDAVWPGGVVSDDVLTHSVVELRKAFGDSAKQPTVIKTIPKRGFQLLLPVRPAEDRRRNARPRHAIRASARPQLWLAGAVVTITLLAIWAIRPGSSRVSVPPAIVVLPFVDISPNRDQEYFADGLSEELINSLASLQGLDVIARGSAFYFKDRAKDLDTIKGLLDVTHVLDGSVRRQADELRITVRLIDAETGVYLWSHSYDQPIENLFAIQLEIAESVATALSIRLGVGELAERPVGGTNNVAAYEAALKGLAAVSQRNETAVAEGIEHFQRATQLDPDYAFAWAKLSEAYSDSLLLTEADEAPQYRRLSDLAVAKANELAPRAKAVRVSSVLKQIARGQWIQAQQTLAEANPESSSDYELTRVYIDLLIKTGRTKKALALAERLRRLNPLHHRFGVYLANLYAVEGRLDEANQVLEAGYQRGHARHVYSIQGLVTSLNTNDPALIQRWLDRSRRDVPGPGRMTVRLAELFHDPPAARAWLQEAAPRLSGRTSRELSADYLIAAFAAYYGDHALALQTLRKTADTWSLWQPFNAALRRDPGFAQLIDHLGLISYWQQFGWSAFCEPAPAGASCS